MVKSAFTKQRKISCPNGGSVGDKQELHNDRDARIAARAFQLFEQRGSKHGYDFQDWL